MAASSSDDSTAGCAGCLGLIAAIAALVSLAAIIDPFAWMPPIDELWADCDADDAPDSCGDGMRDSITGHAAVNLVYIGAALFVLFRLAGAGDRLRTARHDRFDDLDGPLTHRAAIAGLVSWAVLALSVASVPIIVAAA